jgi:hypothetical protein
MVTLRGPSAPTIGGTEADEEVPTDEDSTLSLERCVHKGQKVQMHATSAKDSTSPSQHIPAE